MKNAHFYFTDEEYLVLLMEDDVAEALKKKIQDEGFSDRVITYGDQLINCSLIREVKFYNVRESA